MRSLLTILFVALMAARAHAQAITGIPGAGGVYCTTSSGAVTCAGWAGVIDAANAYGVKCDVVAHSDGAMTRGSATFTASSGDAAFAAADVGKVMTVWGAGASGVPLDTTISAYVGAHAVTLAATAATSVSGAGYYYGTDNSTTLGNAIEAAESRSAQAGINGARAGYRLLLPPGGCATGELTLSGQVMLEGAFPAATLLYLKGGQNTPLILVASAGADFSRVGFPAGLMALSHLRLSSFDHAHNAGFTGAYGIALTSGTWDGTAVLLEDVDIFGMPSTGIYSHVFAGYLYAWFLNDRNNAGWCLDETSSTDHYFYGAIISECRLGDVLLSGDTNINFISPQIFSSTGVTPCLYDYNSTAVTITGGNIGGCGGDGIYVSDLAAANSLVLTGTLFSSNGVGGAGYADIEGHDGTGSITCVACTWTSPPGGGDNIKFDVATIVANLTAPNFNGTGDFTTSGVTNRPGQIILPVSMLGVSTTGSTTQTFTNSPCTASATTERWLPVTVPGQSGTYYVPACR